MAGAKADWSVAYLDERKAASMVAARVAGMGHHLVAVTASWKGIR